MAKILTTCASILVMAGFSIHYVMARPAAPAPTPAHREEGLTRYLYSQSKRPDGFDWTCEDILPARKGGKYFGMGDPKIVPPPANASVPQVVRLLRPQLRRIRVWQDAANKGVIHFAMRRLLAWKDYPLKKKVTAVGTMSIRQLMQRVVAKVAPGVKLYDGIPYVGVVGEGIPGAPLRMPLRLDVRNISIRRLFTGGWSYAIPGNRRGHGQIWEADASEFGPHGRFRRTVQLTICAPPEAWANTQRGRAWGRTLPPSPATR